MVELKLAWTAGNMILGGLSTFERETNGCKAALSAGRLRFPHARSMI
jgi:hypothetical protein